MTITDIIRTTREKKGLTQEAMAELLKTTRSNYAYLENRGEKLTVEQLRNIAGVLQVDLVNLLPESQDLETKASIVDLQYQTLEAYNEILRRENDENRRKLLAVAASLYYEITRELLIHAWSAGILDVDRLRHFAPVSEEEGEIKVGEFYSTPPVRDFPNGISYLSQVLDVETLTDALNNLEKANWDMYSSLIMLYHYDLLPKDKLSQAVVANRIARGTPLVK